MSDTYKTIKETSTGIYKEKGSKFLSFAVPVNNADKVKEILKEYRKEFYDARHVCYAYMLGAERNQFRANDDGEPSGTAGKPILGQINSYNLTDILIVVVRYFGGTLLGTGGLIKAYKEAASDAIVNAEIIEKIIDCLYVVSFNYDLINPVMRIIKETNAEVISQIYEENKNVLVVRIRKQDSEILQSKLESINGVKIKDENTAE